VEHEPGTISLRPVVAVVAILLLAGAAYLGYSCVSTRQPGASFADTVAHYPPDSVTYLANGRTYLVRMANGEFLALSEAEANRSDRIAGCLIRFQADLQQAGETGLFRDDCHGVVYDRQGLPQTDGQAPMQRHVVVQTANTVQVRFDLCLGGGGANTPEACRA
jgi:hypothetical protein